MEGVLEILSSDSVNHSFTVDFFINVQAERSLAQVGDPLPNLTVFNGFMRQRFDWDHLLEEFKGNLNFSFVNVVKQKVNSILAQTIKTLVSRIRLFAFFECLSSHVDQLKFPIFVGLEEFSHTL